MKAQNLIKTQKKNAQQIIEPKVQLQSTLQQQSNVKPATTGVIIKQLQEQQNPEFDLKGMFS